MPWKRNDTPNDTMDFGVVSAGQFGAPTVYEWENDTAAPKTVKLRVRQSPEGPAGLGTASVTLNGSSVPLTADWLDCGSVAPGASLTVTVGWTTSAGGADADYLAEDLAFVEASHV